MPKFFVGDRSMIRIDYYFSEFFWGPLCGKIQFYSLKWTNVSFQGTTISFTQLVLGHIDTPTTPSKNMLISMVQGIHISMFDQHPSVSLALRHFQHPTPFHCSYAFFFHKICSYAFFFTVAMPFFHL